MFGPKSPAFSTASGSAQIKNNHPFDVMVTLAVLAPVHQLLIFRDDKRLCDEFDLLRGFCFGFGEIEFVSAIGTGGEFELDDFVDEFGREGRFRRRVRARGAS